MTGPEPLRGVGPCLRAVLCSKPLQGSQVHVAGTQTRRRPLPWTGTWFGLAIRRGADVGVSPNWGPSECLRPGAGVVLADD